MPSLSPSLGGSAAGTFRGAGWTPKLVVSLLSIVFLIEAVTLAYTTATTALPYVGAHFMTTQGGWLLTTYSLAGAISAPIFGKLADRYGKRRILLTVMVISIVGSIISATAPTFGILLVGRTLEGVLVGALWLSYSLIRDVYPARIVPFAASVCVTGAGALAAVMPTAIGALIDTWGFRSVFWLSAIWVAVMFVLIAVTTAETDVRARSRIDVLGSFLIAVAIGGLLTGISMGNQWGWTAPLTLILIVGGIGVGMVYVKTALSRPDPILNVRMFKRRGIVIAATLAAVAYGVQPAALTLTSMVGLTPSEMGGGFGLGLSATELAQITTPNAIAAVIAGLITGLAVKRVGPWNTARLGMLFLGVGTLYQAIRHETLTEMVLGAVVIGFGSGFCAASVPNLVIAASPTKDQASFSAGVQVVMSTVGGATPVLVFVVLGRSAFVGPGGIPVYTNSALTASYLGAAALAFAGVVLLTTVLRPKVDSFAAGEMDEAQLELLKAELAATEDQVGLANLETVPETLSKNNVRESN